MEGVPVEICATIQIGRLIVQISATLVFNIAPAGPGPLQVGKTTFNGQVGVPFDDDMQITGGTGPYDVQVDPATMPPGLSMGSGGHIGGTPTQAGTFNVTVGVSDATP